MPKTIDTLIPDILSLLDGETVYDLPEELASAFGERMKDLAITRLGPQQERTPSLRMSSIGRPCERQNWYGIHRSDELESLRPDTRLKFLYGDVIEELLLFLAEVAGHRVEGMQDRLEVAGVVGHRDAVIDGTLVDVKSASPFGFDKFLYGRLAEDDAFGYIGQIQTYLEASQDDPLVTDKDRCAFFVMQKVSGQLCLDVHPRMTEVDIPKLTADKLERAMDPDTVPPRGFQPQPDGKSGNMILPMNCSYCNACLLYTSPSPRDQRGSRMPSSA